MKKITNLLLMFLLWTGSILPVSATQINTAELGWTSVGQDSFMVRLTLYAACNGLPTSVLPVEFYCTTTGTFITSLSLSLSSPVDVTPVCKSGCTRCQSANCSFPYGINRYSMQGLVVLSSAGSCCQVKMSWEQCCRNGTITTLGSGGSYFYTEASFDRCLNPGYSSPEFIKTPSLILCVGVDNSFQSGESQNSSSGNYTYTYEWAQPLSATNTPAGNYNGQYAYNRPIYFWGFPNDALPFPRGIHLNSQTGEIQFRPMKSEATIMVVKIKVFKNAVQIAELRRELFVTVIACNGNNPPTVSSANNIKSKNVCAGETVTFNFTTSDANTDDSLKISWNNAIPDATWTVSNTSSKHPSATLTWTPSNAYVSSVPYVFKVVATDNGCPFSMSSSLTTTYQIIVKDRPQAKIIVADSGCGNLWFTAQRIQGSGLTYSWQGKSFPFTPGNGSPVTHKFQPGIYPYVMTTSAGGCSILYYDTVKITGPSFLSVSLPADTTVCPGSYLSINPNIQYAKGKVKYLWSNGDTNKILNIGPVTNPLSISLTVTDSGGCPDSKSMVITILDKPLITKGNPIDICYNINNRYETTIAPVYQVFGYNNFISSFNWHKSGDTTTLSGQPELKTKDIGRFVFSIKDKFGCPASDTFSILNSVSSPKITLYDIDICYNPDNKYPVALTPVCQVFGNNNSVVAYNWHRPGDTATLSNQPVLNTIDTGRYELTITDHFGCTASNSGSILNTLKKPEIQMNEKAFICYNNIVTIKISPFYKLAGNNYIRSYKWQHLGDTTTLSAIRDFISNDTGIYRHTITDKYGCEAADTLKVELTPHIDTTLQQNDYKLTAAAGMKKYEWYRNGSFIGSGSVNLFVAPYIGWYFAVITDSYDCIDSTRSVYVSTTSLNVNAKNCPIKLYPNPTYGKLIIESGVPVSSEISLIVLNMVGKEIRKQTLSPNELQTAKEIDISDQPAGIYTVIIRFQNENFHQLIIKE